VRHGSYQEHRKAENSRPCGFPGGHRRLTGSARDSGRWEPGEARRGSGQRRAAWTAPHKSLAGDGRPARKASRRPKRRSGPLRQAASSLCPARTSAAHPSLCRPISRARVTLWVTLSPSRTIPPRPKPSQPRLLSSEDATSRTKPDGSGSAVSPCQGGGRGFESRRPLPSAIKRQAAASSRLPALPAHFLASSGCLRH
jgi:hypothetical protein